MAVITPARNRYFGYAGYVPTAIPLVRLDICGDPAQLLVRFLNTLDVDEGTDRLGTLEGWREWLDEQDLGQCFRPQRAADLEEARLLRDDLRAMASGQTCAAVRKVGVHVALTGDGEVELSSETPVGFIAAAAAKVAIEQRLDRVKICPADDCRWAFYDTSRNRSRQWCSMEVCGNRAKARAHRERVAGA